MYCENTMGATKPRGSGRSIASIGATDNTPSERNERTRRGSSNTQKYRTQASPCHNSSSKRKNNKHKSLFNISIPTSFRQIFRYARCVDTIKFPFDVAPLLRNNGLKTADYCSQMGKSDWKYYSVISPLCGGCESLHNKKSALKSVEIGYCFKVLVS